jgi:hypothetical protein
MYNYYVIIILLPWILHTQIMPKPLKIKLSIPFTILFYQTFILKTSYSHQMKVSPNFPNTHLYTQKKNKKF